MQSSINYWWSNHYWLSKNSGKFRGITVTAAGSMRGAVPRKLGWMRGASQPTVVGSIPDSHEDTFLKKWNLKEIKFHHKMVFECRSESSQRWAEVLEMRSAHSAAVPGDRIIQISPHWTTTDFMLPPPQPQKASSCFLVVMNLTLICCACFPSEALGAVVTLWSSRTVFLQQLLFFLILFTDLTRLCTFYCHVPPCLFFPASLSSLFLRSAVAFDLETVLLLRCCCVRLLRQFLCTLDCDSTHQLSQECVAQRARCGTQTHFRF